ncbi:hypothetical protein GE061_006900 [Apolygus lucorum]|uniref:HTH psq-type domain-containing protein n=1 Tax=Apolygus lucorum TaxID=248454 RepID=A0A8S9WQF1_APOLU|nr:hypothetical protein GE061_006900 [Apolygus lucorum]
MPSRTRTKLGARPYKKYDQDKLAEAVAAIRNGELSSLRAAAHFNIPRRTLENKVRAKHDKNPGRQTVLSNTEEDEVVEQVLVCADWGMPLDALDLRVIVKNYLDKMGRRVAAFKENLPGPDWYRSFLKRHKQRLSSRRCQNISRARAGVGIPQLKASHINLSVIKACKANDIRFVFLPPSSTHLCQPLDVSVFAPCKRKWRPILENFKMRTSSKTLEKSAFPSLLTKLLKSLEEGDCMKSNLMSGFKKCGIVPFNPEEVFSRIPDADRVGDTPKRVSDSLLSYLQACRRNRSLSPQKKRRKRIDVEPGQAVDESHLLEKARAGLDHPSTSGMGKKNQGVGKKRNKPKGSRRTDSSDESELAFSLHDSESEIEAEAEDGPDTPAVVCAVDDEGQVTNSVNTEKLSQMEVVKLQENMFVVIKLLGKKSVKHYVGKIERFYDDDDFEVTYLRTMDQGKSFYFPVVPDEASVNINDLCYVIRPPYNENRGKITFSDKNVAIFFR